MDCRGGDDVTLRVLDKARAMYTVPRQDLVNEVMIPAMETSVELTCMFGYFDSGSFAHLAPGLAAFLNSSHGTLRLIISPRLNAADQQAVRDAVEDPEAVLDRAAEIVFEGARLSEAALVRHNYTCLAYLLAAGRLELKFALMRTGGLFHPKVWVFRDDVEYAVAQGSSNFTAPGLVFNYETVTLERPWRGPDPAEKAADCLAMFDRLWRGHDADAVVIEPPEAVRYGLLESDPENTPTLDDFWTAWRLDADRGLAPPLPPGVDEPPGLPTRSPTELLLPAGLEIDSGAFAHQGRAVEAWEGAEGRGVLAMATGSGKTVTALVCATRLQGRAPPLLVVVAAPYRPLIAQWEDEVRGFGVEPVPLSRLSGTARDDRLERAVDALVLGVSRVEVLVITHDFLTSASCKLQLSRVPPEVTTFLIADEAHNLGRRSFIDDPPERFDYRLGLSATPERQYDDEGTAALFDYFGPPVFEFSLAEAIAAGCLVRYRYHLHPVELEHDEFEDWKQLTERLRRLGFGGSDVDADDSGEMSPEVKALLMKRRAIIEMARSKVTALRDLLLQRGTRGLRHVLIYASDKGEAQLDAVNRMLGTDLAVIFHQLTAEETASRQRTEQILNDFTAGRYQAITCKRVLDEGVNIPQVAEAYLLASNTVRRQWIQRRGRILRRCDAIGKTHAALHDFLALPPDPDDPAARGVVRQELARAHEFSVLAENAGGDDDPFTVIASINARFGALD